MFLQKKKEKKVLPLFFLLKPTLPVQIQRYYRKKKGKTFWEKEKPLGGRVEKLLGLILHPRKSPRPRADPYCNRKENQHWPSPRTKFNQAP